MTTRRHAVRQALPELLELEDIIREGQELLRVSVPVHVSHAGQQLPVYALELGSRAPQAPTLALIGGVHGVERIGTQVLLAWLRMLIRRREWDPTYASQLDNLRIIMIPLVNPGGMWTNSRCNPNGVDLMRNAPVDSEERTPFLVGGQRISHHLPWYRGKKGSPMEPENQALTDVISKTLFNQKLCLSLDCHSGFGTRDRIWFPYARSFQPWPAIGEAWALTTLFEHTYPHHNQYLFEPQAHSYTTSGDVWDYLYDGYHQQQPDGVFLPMTLEMGSWLWVRKNPTHLFHYHSLFNPVLPHRHQRILRRHTILLDFLMSALLNAENWLPQTETGRAQAQMEALNRWYPHLESTEPKPIMVSNKSTLLGG
ncbi:DUF2817 domain-containing protein [Parathalassolituus penaei]|uniref:DUF2817 domain-containing protein n=1 Tax=Parathalassolituus penaei TaxID=2997323 RepID=A0A9X3EQ02_9GAMM|nr:DUF2817 domain-containing protein [Parathalassolituus penaei]MCY0966748.1 DUF2817 domain-containing protein [Parathalassolituus penaei]